MYNDASFSVSPANKMNTETQRPPNKRRKRKGSQTGGGAGINQAQPAAPNKKRSPGPNFSLASQVTYSVQSILCKELLSMPVHSNIHPSRSPSENINPTSWH